MDLRIQIGQRLVGGFPGKEMSREFIELVKKHKIGNVILFRHNIESKAQLKALCKSIQDLVRSETGYAAFITIDQEGGVVTRLPEDACNVPGTMAIAATGDMENAKIAARITAHELRECGINVNLAPVLDINNNAANPVIGVRSYSDNPELVEAFGCAAIEGYAEGGIMAAAKHFPGHGDTAVDSHLGLPVIDKPLEELEMLELRPFKAAIAKNIPAIMSSHILFPKLEPNNIPCTLSRRIITGLLRDSLGFRGLIMSDCMEMDAIAKYYGTVNAVVSAMSAGVDLIFVTHTEKLLTDAAEAIYQALQNGKLSLPELEESVTRIISMKNIYADCYLAQDINGEAELAKITEMRRNSIALTQGSLFPIGSSPFFTGCADYRATQASNREEDNAAFPAYMSKRLGGRFHITGKNPEEPELMHVVELARGASSIVMCTNNGHLMTGQLKLLRALSQLNIPMVAVALRNPYDLLGLPDNVTGIAAWDYSMDTLKILTEIFAGKFIPVGVMPVKLQGAAYE